MQNKKIDLDNSKIKRYTVTAALPYTNGPVHIGHLAGVYLPADTYVRYLRSNNRDVKFIEEVIYMDENEIFSRVKDVIAEQLGIDDLDTITSETTFIDDLGADSLDVVELIMAFEEEFDLEIPEVEAEKISTVGDVVDYIKENV